MSLKSEVSTIFLGRRRTSRYVAPLAQGAAAHTIFTITGGVVRIHSLFIYCNTALDVAAAGTTFVFAINGIAVSAPAVAVTASIAGDIIVVPLGAAAIVAMGNPYENVPTVIGDTAHFVEGITGPLPTGLIVNTVGVAALGAAEFYTAYCEWTPMEPTALLQ
jgi:hypothetical protein